MIAWSKRSVKTLAATARYQGYSRECPAKLYFAAWVLVAYETGILVGSIRTQSVSNAGERIVLLQNKTSQPIGKRLSLQAQELLLQMIQRSPDGTIFKWAINERNQRIRFQRLIAEAGLVGTPKFLRRSGATYVEAEQPGAASIFLGHKSPEVAEMSYIDTTLIPDRSPRPPSLFSMSKGDCPAISSLSGCCCSVLSSSNIVEVQDWKLLLVFRYISNVHLSAIVRYELSTFLCP